MSQSDVPSMPLAEALRVARTIRDEYGSQAVSPFDLAVAMQITPGGSQIQSLTGASIAYGLTEGGAQAASISLTQLGRRVVAPLEEGDDQAAMCEAFLRPRVVGEFMHKYADSPWPSELVAKNVLESLGVDRAATDRTLELIRSGAESLGLLVPVKNKLYVRLTAAGRLQREDNDLSDPQNDLEDTVKDEPEVPRPNGASPALDSRPKPIFLGHGKKKAPLEKLQKILSSFGIPFKTAVAEPNLGRPIPKKVKDVMSECGSAILIFTCDEEFKDASGATIWRPSENVVHELGAASFA